MTVAAAEKTSRKARQDAVWHHQPAQTGCDGQKAQLALTAEDKRRARITATREIYAKCILFDYSYKFFMRTATAKSR